jgi:GNAT superfamily N-acetyltransferase
MSSVRIRRAAATRDAKALWPIFHAVVAAGETYAYDPATDFAGYVRLWFELPKATYLAEGDDGAPLGTYYIKENHAGYGNHVANAGFMVGEAARGLGVGRAMGEHALAEARRMGFAAMQFNFVVSTNTRAVRLWESLGFRTIGTIPAAFRHPRLGLVDAYVMHRTL